MQKAAERAAALTPTYYTDSNKLKQPQSAIVAIDPKTGYIKAMIGGRGRTSSTGPSWQSASRVPLKPLFTLTPWNMVPHQTTLSMTPPFPAAGTRRTMTAASTAK